MQLGHGRDTSVKSQAPVSLNVVYKHLYESAIGLPVLLMQKVELLTHLSVL